MIRAVQTIYLSIIGALCMSFAALLPIFAPWKVIFLMAPAIFAAVVLLFYPFLGLTGIVALSHVDAVGTRVSAFLPISAYKLLTIGTVGALLIHLQQNRDAPISWTFDTLVTRLILLFLLWATMSGLLSSYPDEAKDRLQDFALLFVLYMLILTLTDTQQKFEILIWTLVGTCAFSALVVMGDTLLGTRLLSTSEAAITAQWEGQARSSGASNFNPTTASHMLLATTIISGVLFLFEPRWRVISGAVAVLGLIALSMSLARSAMIAGGVVSLVIGWSFRRHKFFTLGVLVGVAAGVAALPFVGEALIDRMSTIVNFETDRTLFRRLTYNLIGLDLFSKNPVFGIGPGNFPLYYIGDEYRWYPGRELAPRQLHNTYMEVAVETGLIGLGLFLAFLITAMRAVWKVAARHDSLGSHAKALFYGFLGFLIASIFMPNEDIKFTWMLPALCVCAARLDGVIVSPESRKPEL